LRHAGSVLAGLVVFVGTLAVASAPAAFAAPEDTVSASVPASVQGTHDGCVGAPVAVPYTMKSRIYDNPRVTVKVTGPGGSAAGFEVIGWRKLMVDAGTLQVSVPMCDYQASGTYTVSVNLWVADYDYCAYDYTYDEAYCVGIEDLVSVDAAPVSFEFFAPVDVVSSHKAKVSKSRRVVKARFKTEALPAGYAQGAPAAWKVTVNDKKAAKFELGADQVKTVRVSLPATGRSVVKFYLNDKRVETLRVVPRT
jgi:hypothetical protein